MGAATTTTRKVAFVQDGARLHYAVPLALQREGLLERMYADWYGPPRSAQHLVARLLQPLLGVAARRMQQRYCLELDRSRVISNPLFALRHQLSRKRFATEPEFGAWSRAAFGRWIIRRGFGNADTLMGFVHNIDPHLLEVAGDRGLLTVADQVVAPFQVLCRESDIQRSEWSDWENVPHYIDRSRIPLEQDTWAACNRITCASQYVREGLIEQGVPADKVVVIPYPVDITDYPWMDRTRRDGPIRVGCVGSVSLRKGIQYFMQVAQRFDPSKVRFVWVGPVYIRNHAADMAAKHVHLAGQVPRHQIAQWLAEFDIFLFPSTCEGSAGSVMEAMATGLPVITSANSGSIIRSGETGFIVPYDDLDGMAAAVTRLAADPHLRQTIGRRAAESVGQCSISAYGKAIAALLAAL